MKGRGDKLCSRRQEDDREAFAATRLRASASSDAAMKDVNLAETSSEAQQPIPMALTALEMVQ